MEAKPKYFNIMAKKFSCVRDIIDDYEKNLLSLIKQELASCRTGKDYVYGKHMIINDKDIWNCNWKEDKGDYVEEDLNPIDDYQKLSSFISRAKVVFDFPNPHQRRHFPQNTYQNEIQNINMMDIQKWRFTNFEHLYDVIRTIFFLNGHTNASLTMYDTALRIGYNHAEPILPNKFVYLYGEKNNTGPWGGAAALYGVTPWMKNNVDKDYPTRIKTRWFADKFPNLSAWEIESILCIYRKHFTFNMPY